jgi:hypothetical protein
MTSHSPKTEADRLLALSEKVGRVAESLAELALERDSVGRPGPGADAELSADTVGWLIRARRERANYVPAGLFGEPAWDLMLNLLHANLEQRHVAISSACLATGLPEELGRRWLDAMVENGMATVRKNPGGGDDQVELTADVSQSLRRYFRNLLEDR